MDNYTALLVPLDESCEGVQSFRSKHVHMPAVGVPPHVSVFYPFYPVEAIDQRIEERIANAVANHFPIDYTLDGFGVFAGPGVLYLRPRPETAFLSLFMEIKNEFKDLRSAFDPPSMHLTIAHGENEIGMDDLKDDFLDLENVSLPISAKANRLALYEKKNGVWSMISEYKCEPAGSGDDVSHRSEL